MGHLDSAQYDVSNIHSCLFHQLYKHVVQIVEKFIKKVCVH